MRRFLTFSPLADEWMPLSCRQSMNYSGDSSKERFRRYYAFRDELLGSSCSGREVIIDVPSDPNAGLVFAKSLPFRLDRYRVRLEFTGRNSKKQPEPALSIAQSDGANQTEQFRRSSNVSIPSGATISSKPADGRFGFRLLVVVVGCFGGSLLAGFQPRVPVLFVVGGVGLIFCLGIFLRSFRPLRQSIRGQRWLKVSLLVMVLHGLFLFTETALRLANTFQRRSLSRAAERHQNAKASKQGEPAESDETASESDRWLKTQEAFVVNKWLPSWRSTGMSRVLTRKPPLEKSLVPNSTIRRLDSVIHINSHGTRGPEFSLTKAPNELRVVCLGASTTWGATAKADDRTYPEVLEEYLRKKLDRPVTVINGGMVGVRINFTALRFEHEMLRFDPDVVVVYNGINDIPSGIIGDSRFQPKASLLISKALLLDAKRSDFHKSRVIARHATFREGMNRIAELCAQHDIKLFVCSFALAYDEQTPPELLDFYQRIMPLYGRQSALSALDSLRLNNEFTRQVGERPGVGFVDVESLLGGRYKYFIDFCHFTQPGRDLLAEAIGQAILDQL
jgi:lysophospholipase L1-like esterase